MTRAPGEPILTRTPPEELERRCSRVREGLREAGMDAAIVVQGVDLFYLAGTSQQGHLVLPAEGEPLLLVRRDLERARAESALARVEGLDSFRALPEAVRRAGVDPAGTLGLELDVLPVAHLRRYESVLPGARLVDCSPVIREVRSVKSDYELALMARSAVMADQVMREAAMVLREGMTEIEFSAHLEAAARVAGHQGFVRFRAFGQELLIVHVFAGPEAAVPSFMDTPLGGRGLTAAVPQGAGRRAIGRGEPVVIDFVGVADGYGVDQTRILSVGPLPTDLREAYGACLDIQGLVRRLALPGVAAGEVYQAAVERAVELGYADVFMGSPGRRVSFIGHGVGLEVDEPPVVGRGASRRLEIGNTVAIEPKMVFEGRGVVGVENTWVVEPGGLRALTFADESLIET